MKGLKKCTVIAVVCLLLCIVTSSTVFAGGDKSVKTIRWLGWNGYIDQDWVKEFEEENNCKFEITFIGNSDELWAKALASEGAVELITIDSSIIQRYKNAGLLQPIDFSRLENLHYVNENIPFEQYLEYDGEKYAVPLAWGGQPVMYNTDTVKELPSTSKVFWDPKYRKRITVRSDIHILWAMVAATWVDSNPWNPTPEDSKIVEQKLRELHAQVLTYYSGTTEGVNLISSGEVDLVYCESSIMVAEALRKGANVKEMLPPPEEGTPTWLDNLVVGSKAENLDIVYKFLDFCITPEYQGTIGQEIGYGVAVPDATNFMDPEMVEITHMDDPGYWNYLFLFEPVPDDEYSRRVALWNEIKAE